MKDQLISVIIPAYNAEDYITKCIDSVLCQTYKNLEIIVVNDGSKDNTKQVVGKYLGRVILLNKENGGLCSARKYGVDHANGDYIVFLDSDDYLEKDFIWKLYEQTSGRDDELIMCDFLKNGIKESENCTYLEVDGKANIFALFLRGGIYNRTVNKIYPVKIIKEIEFPIGRDMLEDAYFTSHVLEKCNHIVRIPYAGYNYIRHDGSMTKTKLSDKQLISMHSNLLEKDWIISKHISGPDHDYLATKIVKHIKDCMIALRKSDINNVYNNIHNLATFLQNSNYVDKKQKRFSSYLLKGKTQKTLRYYFFLHTLYFDSIKFKFAYFKATIRKALNIKKR